MKQGDFRKLLKHDYFPPLEEVTRPTIPTRDAAYYLNREPQTLRSWSCFECGPIRPINVFGKLTWNVSKIRELLGVK